MKRATFFSLLASCFLAASTLNLLAQSIWTGGAGTTNWNTPGNWTGGVPAAGKTVTINTCSTCPRISTSGAQAAFVQVYAGGKLTIANGGILTIENPGGPGMKTHATSQVQINQGGGLTIQNFWGEGLAIGGTLTNGGNISINGGHTGIAVSAGASFTNNTNGTTSVTGSSLNYGMTSSGTVQNNGVFNLDDANNDGISQQTGTITNGVNGTLNLTKTGVNAIFAKGTFNNNGVLNIDNGLNGIYLLFGTFNNNANGKLTITGTTWLNEGIYIDPGTFKNSGELTIQNAGSKGIEISGGSTFNNFNKITLDVPAWAGIFNVGGSNFTNKPCALVETNAAVVNYATFTNKGIIKSTAASISSVGVNDGIVIGAFTVASGNVPITEDAYVWTGCAGSDWSSPYNWYPLGLPESFNTAIVQNVANASGNAPVVNSAALGILSLRLDNGALLTIASGGTLSVRSPVSWIPTNASIRTGGKLKVNAGGSFSAQDVSLDGTIDNSGAFSLGCGIVGAGGMTVSGGVFNNLAGGNFSSSACSPQGVGATVSLTNSANFNNSGMVSMPGVARCSLVMSTLKINPGGSFFITGDGAGGIVGSNGSTLNNLGFLGTGFVEWTNSTFTNSGDVQIHNHSPGFFAENSTCTNSGSLWLYLAYMLLYNGTFDNSGSLKIENAFDNAFNSSAEFTNSGSLEVQFYTPTTHHAMIILDGNFVNTPTGDVWVRGMSIGLINWGGFTNRGMFKVENASHRGIEHNSFTGKPFLNEATGQIIIDGTDDIGFATFQTPLLNAGHIEIRNTTGIGLGVVGTFENQASGILVIEQVPTNYGLLNWNTVKNYGAIHISDCGNEGLAPLAYFENFSSGIITVVQNQPSVWPALSNSFTFVNSGTVNLQGDNQKSISNGNDGNLTNRPCAVINVNGSVNNLGVFNNQGYLTTAFSGTNANSGAFNNTGFIEDFYDWFNGVSFNNVAVRARPISGQAGGFILNALEIGFNSPFAIGTTWYLDANQTNPAGTYNPGVNTFQPTVGVGTHTLYFTAEDLVHNCRKTVSIQVSIVSALIGYKFEDENITLYNYPNPFSQITAVNVSLPFDSEGKLAIFDAQGRLVEVLYEGEIKKDELYQFEFNGAEKRVGLYAATLILKDGRTYPIRLVKADNVNE